MIFAKPTWTHHLHSRPLFYICFSILSVPSVTPFHVNHLGRPWAPKREPATSPRLRALGFVPKPGLNQAFRLFSIGKQVLKMATTRLEFGVEAPVKIPNTGIILLILSFFLSVFCFVMVIFLVVFVGKKEALQNDELLPLLGGVRAQLLHRLTIPYAKTCCQVDKAVRDQMLQDVSVGDTGASISTYLNKEGKLTKLVFAVLPSKSSRHNSAFQPHAISSLLGSAVGTGSARVNVLLEEEWQVAPIACAVARAFPLYTCKQKSSTSEADDDRVISVDFLLASSSGLPTRVTSEARLRAATVAADGVRLAGKLVDTPPQEMDTEALVAEARRVSTTLPGVKFEVVSGRDLDKKGYGGIWGVGKAAEKPPALAVLSWEPESPTETVCLVGKGIVYDTGSCFLRSIFSLGYLI